MDIYKALEKAAGFEWDKGNIEKNLAKHSVKNIEAEEVFFNFNIVCFDEKHSVNEERYFLLGATNESKILFVAFTIRNNKIRTISSRIASNKEMATFRKEYKKYEN